MQAKLLNCACRRYKYNVCKERDQKKLIRSISIPLLAKVNAKEKVSESNAIEVIDIPSRRQTDQTPVTLCRKQINNPTKTVSKEKGCKWLHFE